MIYFTAIVYGLCLAAWIYAYGLTRQRQIRSESELLNLVKEPDLVDVIFAAEEPKKRFVDFQGEPRRAKPYGSDLDLVRQKELADAKDAAANRPSVVSLDFHRRKKEDAEWRTQK